jgi:hypothetical protein
MSKRRPGSIIDLFAKGDVDGGHRSRERADEYLGALIEALDISPHLRSRLKSALCDFIVADILGAAWYQKRYKSAGWKTWAYIALNVFLLLGIPLGLVALNGLMPKAGGSALPGQITGILTGILALQKTLSGWYSSQQRYATWYKCAADLKAIYYDLIQTWHGRIAAPSNDFIEALEAATAAARKILSDEQQDFYEKLSLPSFDVLDMLTGTRGAVSGLVTSLLPGGRQTTIVAAGKNALPGAPVGSPLAAGAHPALTNGAVQLIDGVRVMAAGAAKPNHNPYTIVIVANPAIESPAESGFCSRDPILDAPDRFAACVAYVIQSVFGKLPGQAEKFMAPFEKDIRILAIFDAKAETIITNALVSEYGMDDLIGPRQQQFADFLAGYLDEGRPVKADVAFAISASTHTRSASQYTFDDDGAGGVPFDYNGTALSHRYTNVQPGAVALHVDADTVVPLHEFSHAASSWTNGCVQDLYIDCDLTNGPINIAVGRPIPAEFGTYSGKSYKSDVQRDGLGYEAGWSSYHCALVDPNYPALMDDFTRARGGRSLASRHDQITVQFLTDRIKAIMSRP